MKAPRSDIAALLGVRTLLRRQNAFDALHARLEGILPALESSHALCRAMEIAASRKPDDVVVVCLSGRGDKDAAEIARLRGLEF